MQPMHSHHTNAGITIAIELYLPTFTISPDTHRLVNRDGPRLYLDLGGQNRDFPLSDQVWKEHLATTNAIKWDSSVGHTLCELYIAAAAAYPTIIQGAVYVCHRRHRHRLFAFLERYQI